MGSMAAPKNPWRRMPMALSETVSRTRVPERMGERVRWFGKPSFVHGKGSTGDHRRAIEVADARLKRDRHQGHLVRATHATCHIRGRWHRALGPRPSPENPSGPAPASPDRPCRCTSRQCYAAVRWMHTTACSPLATDQIDSTTYWSVSRSNAAISYNSFGCSKLDDPVTFSMIHVHDDEAKPCAMFGRQYQTRCVHGVGEGQIQR